MITYHTREVPLTHAFSDIIAELYISENMCILHIDMQYVHIPIVGIIGKYSYYIPLCLCMRYIHAL